MEYELNPFLKCLKFHIKQDYLLNALPIMLEDMVVKNPVCITSHQG